MALAEPPPEARSGAPAAAESLRRADAARRAGRWSDAAGAYREAWTLDPRPEIAGELGVCELALGRHRDAAEHLQIALDQPAALPPALRRRFEAAQEQAERRIVTVAVGAHPASAEVWVDGRSLGPPRETYLVFLEPGRHTFRATLAGYHDAQHIVEWVAGSAPAVSLPLRPLPPPAPPAPAAPAAPPPLPAPCPPGVACGGKVTRALRIAGFAAAGVTLAAGAGMALGAADIQADLADRAAARGREGCWGKGALGPCRELAAGRAARDALAGGAVLAFAGGGVLAGVTVSSFWWAPAAGSRLVGATLRGRW